MRTSLGAETVVRVGLGLQSIGVGKGVIVARDYDWGRLTLSFMTFLLLFRIRVIGLHRLCLSRSRVSIQ